MCRSVSPLNIVAFVFFIAAILASTLCFVAPFWITFPNTSVTAASFSSSLLLPPKAMRDELSSSTESSSKPFVQWIGLWAECYPGMTCKWFWENNFEWEKSLIGWYKASQAIFGIAIGVLIIAFILQCVFTCCRCCAETTCYSTIVASIVLAGSLLCGLSLGLYSGFSAHDMILSPVSVGGQGGTLDWAFYVGIAGASVGVLVAILFYVDGCIQARNYRGYKAPVILRT